jgi:hypothetical protein
MKPQVQWYATRLAHYSSLTMTMLIALMGLSFVWQTLSEGGGWWSFDVLFVEFVFLFAVPAMMIFAILKIWPVSVGISDDYVILRWILKERTIQREAISGIRFSRGLFSELHIETSDVRFWIPTRNRALIRRLRELGVMKGIDVAESAERPD